MKIVKALSILLLFLVLLYFWAAGFLFPLKPPSVKDIIYYDKKTATTLGAEFKILTYNIAYGRGLKDDAGDLRDKKTVEGYLGKIAEFLRQESPDIVAMQEVDLNSKRTWFINEMEYLAKKAGFPYVAYVITWNKNYIPYPYDKPSQYYGQMVSGQAILSKFEIVENRGIALPQPSENTLIYNNFYLERHIQLAKIKLSESLSIHFYNIHLEAFSNKNRMEQANILSGYLLKDTLPKLVAGDFNAVPIMAAQKINFTDEPEADFTDDRTMEILGMIENLYEIIAPEVYSQNELSTLTFPADRPTRRLDYIFYSSAFERVEGKILNPGPLSDHLPVSAVFKLK